MNAETLRWEDWCFDKLNDRELIPCIYWEYARESRTIRALATRYEGLWKEFSRRLRGKPKEFVTELKRTFRENLGTHFPEDFKLGEDIDRIDVGDWRVLLPIFATSFAGKIILQPDYFPKTPWMASPVSVCEHVECLVEHQPWHRYANSWFFHKSLKTGKTPKGALTPPISEATPTHDSRILRAGADWWEDVVLRIHWSGGTNEEIVSAFRKWLIGYRKDYANIPPPKRVRANANKAWLKRLAEMRLWNAGEGLAGGRGIVENYNALRDHAANKTGKHYSRDQQLTEPITDRSKEKAVREDISRVSKDLRRLFGWIVPKDEVPLSYPFRSHRAR